MISRVIALLVTAMLVSACATAPTISEIEAAPPAKTMVVARNYERLALCVDHQYEGEQAYGLFAHAPRTSLKVLPEAGVAEVIYADGSGPIYALYEFHRLSRSTTKVVIYIPKSHGNIIVLAEDIDGYLKPVGTCGTPEKPQTTRRAPGS